MRFCNRCRKLTTGDPLFCTWCGSTYALKYCARMHPNPPYAVACSQCGSRDMTMPQPRIPVFLRPLVFLFEQSPKLLLVVLVGGFALLFLHWLINDHAGQQLLACLALILVFAVFIWRLMPPLMQRVLRASFLITKSTTSFLFRRATRKRQ